MPRVPVHTVQSAPEGSRDDPPMSSGRCSPNYFNHFVGTEIDVPQAPSLDDEAAA